MKLLSRQDILNARDIKTEIVKVPEWGGNVMIKAMTAAERDKWESSRYTVKGTEITMKLDNIRARLVSLSCIDEANNPLFTVADIEALGAKSAAALDRIYTAINKINGLTKSDSEDLEKNSNAIQPDTSVTA